MNILNSKYYPKIMFLALIVVSLLIVFNMTNIIDNAKLKHDQKSISGFVTGIDRTNNSEVNSYNNTEINNSSSQEHEMYSAKSYAIYYILIIGIIAGIFITFSVLKSTVLRNIDLEEKERRL